MELVNLSIYYTCKNIKFAYTNNEFKISAPTRNGKFDFPDRSYSVAQIQDYFQYINEKPKTITDNPSIQIYVNIIKNWIAFKIKTDYKLELFSKQLMWPVIYINKYLKYYWRLYLINNLEINQYINSFINNVKYYKQRYFIH